MTLSVGILLVLTAISTTPAQAKTYPYCVRKPFWGHGGECMYSNHSQCLAAVKGNAIVCGKNVRLSFRHSAADR
jgi:hypothetical protein